MNNSDKEFSILVAGDSSIKSFSGQVSNVLDLFIENNFKIMMIGGDIMPNIIIQEYLERKGYKNVEIFCKQSTADTMHYPSDWKIRVPKLFDAAENMQSVVDIVKNPKSSEDDNPIKLCSMIFILTVGINFSDVARELFGGVSLSELGKPVDVMIEVGSHSYEEFIIIPRSMYPTIGGALYSDTNMIDGYKELWQYVDMRSREKSYPHILTSIGHDTDSAKLRDIAEMLATTELPSQVFGSEENTIFISGSSSMTMLPIYATTILKFIVDNEIKVIIGDAPGVDTMVQKWLYDCCGRRDGGYRKVTVYYTRKSRSNLGNWDQHRVPLGKYEHCRTEREPKDIEMSHLCSNALVIWDGLSVASFNNILRVVEFGKSVTVLYDHMLANGCVGKHIMAGYILNNSIDELGSYVSPIEFENVAHNDYIKDVIIDEKGVVKINGVVGTV